MLYLAYGSNLAYETFQGRRGIKPLSQVNVLVPELRMTFDLPGMPYVEPCFANTGLRHASPGIGDSASMDGSGSEREIPWKKGLVGVVYEVTPVDYAHIIATEGGGGVYKDIVIDCHPLEVGSPSVPEIPLTKPFKAHTLFAMPSEVEQMKYRALEGYRRDPTYAQPSARYLNLITSGGKEHGLPAEYQEYLDSLHAYTITTVRQRVGRSVFQAIWVPIMTILFSMMEFFGDKETGRVPTWLGRLSAIIIMSVWKSYDGFFKPVFGDGERTIGDDEEATVAGERPALVTGWLGGRYKQVDEEQAQLLTASVGC